ncbi:hypothetical protein [Microcoleus sp. PH2017_32_RDM_D_A]|nr:hypothetical protein [Microcoleus sp. PH2017_32_RDM_D_A]
MTLIFLTNGDKKPPLGSQRRRVRRYEEFSPSTGLPVNDAPYNL